MIRGTVALVVVLAVVWLVFSGEAPEEPGDAPTGVTVPEAEAPAEPEGELPPKIRVAATAEGRLEPTAAEPDGEPTEGFEVRGHVTGPDSESVSGASVRVEWREESLWPPHEGRLEATTDERGEYVIGLDGLLAGRATMARLTFTFQGTARAAGLATRPPLTARFRDTTGRVVKLDLTVAPDASTTGRVIDRMGDPVAAAEIRFHAEGSDREVFIGSSDADGVFRTTVPDAGSYVVWAHAPGTGVGSVGPFELDPRVPTRLPDLACDAPGTLAGVAVLPDGNPASELEVLAFPVGELRRAERHLLAQRWRVGPRSLEGLDGAWPATATTDASGAFRIAGIAPVEHFLLVRNTTDAAPDSRTLHAAGTTGIVLRVVRHRLVVDVRSPSGEPVNARVGFRHGAMGLPPTGLDAERRPFTDRFGPGDVVTIEALASRAGAASKTVTIADGDHENIVRVDLVAEEQTGTGRLVLHAEGPDGGIDRLRVRLSRSGPSPLASVDGGDRELDLTPGEPVSLPAGSWNVLVLEAGAPWTFGPWRDSWFSPVRTRVTVEAGATTTAHLPVLTPGGRLGLNVTRVDLGTAPVSLERAELWSGPRKQSLHFVDERGFFDPWHPFDIGGIPIGVPLTSPTLLPVGDARLLLRCEGFALIEREVTIHPRQTTSIDVTLHPR